MKANNIIFTGQGPQRIPLNTTTQPDSQDPAADIAGGLGGVEEFLEIIPLGAGCEVGRSCLYMQCKGIKIMLDCGLHPAREGI